MIRAACAERDAQLEALVRLRDTGALDVEAFTAKRKDVVHLPKA